MSFVVKVVCRNLV
ncbi:hypothetical protein M2G92_11350 [Vibrio vulnificus]|nr:hypothetical protein [Vibrio vulnificus]